MANNVLDKSAMATLARLENELPRIGRTLEKLESGQGEITHSIGRLCKDAAVTASRVQRNKDDIQVQRVECKEVSTRVSKIQDDVAGLKATDRIVGGANAIYTTIAGVIVAVFGGN